MIAVDISVIVGSYLAGSLPMGLWIGRARGVDLSRQGSGNIGATNAGRVLGKPFFYVVFALDFAKSCGPVLFARRLGSSEWLAADRLGLAAGIAAVLGHVFPIFLGFKGGKGVATAAGVFAALAPLAAAIAFAAWFVVFRASRIVSLASLTAAIVLPAACWLVPRWTSVPVDRAVQWAALLVGALIIVRHKTNIGRLVRGEEPRAGAKFQNGR